MARPYKPFKMFGFQGGYDSLSSPELLDQTKMARGSVNLTIQRGGMVSKRLGYSPASFDAVPDSHTEVVGLSEFYDGTHSKRALIRTVRNTSSGKIYWGYQAAVDFPIAQSSWTTNGTEIGTGTAKDYSFFTRMLDRLYVANKALSIVKYFSWNGSAFAITSMSTTGSVRTFNKPQGLLTWYNRVWTFLDSSVEGGTYLFYSNTPGTVWDLDLGWLKIDGNGPITGMIQIDKRLLIFKQNETFLISGGDNPTRGLEQNRLSADIGCISPRSLVHVEGWVYFMSDKGFYRTDGIDFEPLSKPIENEVGQIARSEASRIVGVHNRHDSQVVFFVPFGPVSDNNRAYVYDYFFKAWNAPYTNQAFNVAGLYHNDNTGGVGAEYVMVGGQSHSGQFYIWNSGYLDGASFTNAKLYTKALDFGEPETRKLVRKVYAHLAELGGTTGSTATGLPWDTGGWGGAGGVGWPGGADVDLKCTVYTSYGNADSAVAPDDSQVMSGQLGTLETPIYVLNRNQLTASGHYVQIAFEDYSGPNSPGGPWALTGFTVLYVQKGFRP